MQRKILATMAAAAIAVAVSAAPAAANGMGYGKKIQDDFGAPYGKILNSVRGDTSTHDTVVFPPAAGAKAFYEIHTGS